MPEGLVRVRWVGPFDADLIEGGSVAPGDIIEVTAQQAAESAWFEPINEPKASRSASPPKSEEVSA